MERSSVKEELTAIIKPYIPEQELFDSLTESSDLIKDLRINSAHIVDIVLDIEEKYDIMIDDDSIGKMNTVGESIDIILSKIEGR